MSPFVVDARIYEEEYVPKKKISKRSSSSLFIYFMQYQQAIPSDLLKPFILRYYQVNGTTSESEPMQDFVLPNGYTSFVFHFEEQIKVSNVSYDGERIPKFYIFGKYTKPIFVYHSFGRADVFGVIFKPSSFFHFFPVPQQELTDIVIDVVDGFGKEMEEILEQMYEHNSFQERQIIIEEFFLRRLSIIDPVPNVVEGVLAEIKKSKGKIKVSELASKFRITRQHLNRLFLSKVGLNVKEYIRTVRFNAALQAMTNQPYNDLLQLVVDFGYYDESHLIKDFHHFTAGRPSEFLAKENELAKFLLGG